MTPDTARGLLSSKSLNLRILIERAVGNCRNYALAFDDAHNLLPPAAQLFATPDLPVVLNSLHILGRLLPFLLEPHDAAEVEAELAALFWTSEPHRTVRVGLADLLSRLSAACRPLVSLITILPQRQQRRATTGMILSR